MPESHSLPQAANAARTMQAALSLGRRLDLWSLALALLALLCLLGWSLPLFPIIGLSISLLAAGVQKFFALRVAFDEKLFRNLAKHCGNPALHPDTSPLAELAKLDRSLALCMQRQPPEDGFRNLDSRIQGASWLLKRQVLAFFVQFATIIASATATNLPPAG